MLLLLKQYHMFQSQYNIISCIIIYNMPQEYEMTVWKREAYLRIMSSWTETETYYSIYMLQIHIF